MIHQTTYNYNINCGYVPMMAQAGFMMNFMAMATLFNPFSWFGGMFNGWSSPMLNSAMFNTYAYNPSNNNSIFSAGNYYNSDMTTPSSRFVYTPTGSTGSIFKPSREESVITTPTVENDESDNDNTYNNSGEVLDRRGNGYGKQFLDKVKQIAQRINCDYRDLLAVMNAESRILAHKENPDPQCSATGLIQFTRKTATQFGTSIPELIQMSPVRQLDYVEKYLVYWKKTSGLTGRLSAGDLYALVFLPGRAGREVITEEGESYYSAGGNENLDRNNDGKITKSELSARVKEFYVSDRSFID